MVECGLGELLLYMGIWLPWPLREPEMMMRALGVNMLPTEGVLLMTLQDLWDDLPVRLITGV
jgi:hypothetical protein